MGNIKVVDGVAEGVGIGKDLRRRLQFQVEAGEPLARRLLGLHPDLHDALPDRGGVMVAGDVSNLEKHGVS
jgi:hypothetical protein